MLYTHFFFLYNIILMSETQHLKQNNLFLKWNIGLSAAQLVILLIILWYVIFKLSLKSFIK